MAEEADPPGNIMAPKISPSDIGTKVKREYILSNGWKWSYLDAPPQGPQRAVAVLIHGFPDQSLAWRYQIPQFTALGIRTIALDCMGYGDTGASDNLRDYGFKAHADVVAAIAKKIGTHKIIIGGHDWGGATVYRIAQWYPDLISHIFSVCTSYAPPTKEYISTQTLSETSLPQFGYQLQLGSPHHIIEQTIHNHPEALLKFLSGMFGGRPTTPGKKFLTPEHGIDLTLLSSPAEHISPSPLLDPEELSYYLRAFRTTPLRGALNWYRTRRINYEDDLGLPAETGERGSVVIIRHPTLYILATRDAILTREMSRHMEKLVPNLTRGEVDAGHWALWQKPDEVNAILTRWLEEVVLVPQGERGRSML